MATKSKTPNIDRAVKFILENQGKYCCFFDEDNYGDLSYIKSGGISEITISSEEEIFIKIISADYDDLYLDFNSDYTIAIMDRPKDA